MSLFDRVDTTSLTEATETDKTGKITCGVFVPLPYNLAKQFPPKPAVEDDSAPHVTLLYIGAVTPEEQAKVVKAVREVAKDWPPFHMDVSAYGEFENEKGQTIAHMVPTAMARKKGPAGVFYRTMGELHADLHAGVEATGVKIGHTYGPGKKGSTPRERSDSFKLHTTLAHQPKGVAYTGRKPTGNFQVNEIEVWGWETYRIPLGSTTGTADQPTGAPMQVRDPNVQTMTDPELAMRLKTAIDNWGHESKPPRRARVETTGSRFDALALGEAAKPASRFMSMALGEEGGAGNTPEEPGAKPDKMRAGSPKSPAAKKPEPDAKEPNSDPNDAEVPPKGKGDGKEGEEPEGGEAEEPEFNPVHKHGHATVVGVEHGKPINLPPEDIEELKKNAKHGVHHEGPELDADPGVADFVGQHLGGKAEPWEPEDPKPGDPRWHPHLALSLFGGDTEQLHHQVTTHDSYDPKKTIHDNLLATGDAWHHPEHGHHVSSHDLNHLVKSISDDPAAAEVHPEAKNLHKLLHGPMEDFKKFHKVGFAATFPQDSGFHEHHTKIARVADTANVARDAHLAHMMRTKGGVYFAGKDHVPAVAARLARKGSASAKVHDEGASLFDRLLDEIVAGDDDQPHAEGPVSEDYEADQDYVNWLNGFGNREDDDTRPDDA
jgi:hypothetical protein